MEARVLYVLEEERCLLCLLSLHTGLIQSQYLRETDPEARPCLSEFSFHLEKRPACRLLQAELCLTSVQRRALRDGRALQAEETMEGPLALEPTLGG